jgi:hypothetical protein
MYIKNNIHGTEMQQRKKREARLRLFRDLMDPSSIGIEPSSPFNDLALSIVFKRKRKAPKRMSETGKKIFRKNNFVYGSKSAFFASLSCKKIFATFYCKTVIGRSVRNRKTGLGKFSPSWPFLTLAGCTSSPSFCDTFHILKLGLHM